MYCELQKVCQPSFVYAESLINPSIKHGFFGRNGGISSGFFSTLNASFKDNDLRENVLENRKRIANTLGFEGVFTVKQAHEAEVLVVDNNTPKDQTADAMITKFPGILLAIQTADCAPILLSDPINKIVAGIHAGWRSAVKNIVPATIEKMLELGAKLEHISATIGPCIQQQSFEVGEDVKHQANADIFFKPSNRENHYLFDLPGYILSQLKNAGINNSKSLGLDTYALKEKYFSFRRSTHENALPCGGQISCIGIST
jgi:YfiH family protein